jgi:hypothetical protein
MLLRTLSNTTRHVAAGAGLVLGLASCFSVPYSDEGSDVTPGPDNGGLVGPDPGFRLVYPAPGAQATAAWERESQHAILWQTSPNVTAIPDLLYSLDEGVTWTTVEPVDSTGRRVVDGDTKRARLSVPATGGNTIRVRLDLRGQRVETASFPLSPSQRKNYSFTRISENIAIPPRDGACSLVYGGYMWTLGGWNPDVKSLFPEVTSNDVWRSSDGVAWEKMKANTFVDADTFNYSADWSGRHAMGCTTHGGKMLIVGGDPVHTPVRDVWSSTNGVKWERNAQNTAFPTRVFQQTFSFQDKLWVVGGQTYMSEFTLAYPDVWNSVDGISWNRVTSSGPPPRAMIHGELAYKGRMWLVSGGLYDDPNRPKRSAYDDVWSSADGVSWRRELEHTPFSPRYFINVAIYDDRMWMMGGYNGTGNLGDVYYTSDGANWYEAVTPPTLVGRHSASAWSYKGALYWGIGNAELPQELWGKMGLPPENRLMADMWKITPAP